MKRDLSVVTDEVRKHLQRWINLGSNSKICPFPIKIRCSKICPAVFPKLRPKKVRRAICPCDYYDKKYVIRIAKKIIKCPQK